MILPLVRAPAGILIAQLLAPATAVSQELLLSGTIQDSVNGAAIRGARVEARSASAVTRTESDQRGGFRITLREGTWTVAVSFVGYTPWTSGPVTVAGSPASLTVRLVPQPAVLGAISVVARDSRLIIDAPAAATLLDLSGENAVAVSPARYLEHDPGITVSRKGLNQATFSARGPSSASSAGLLVLHDYRLASVPSLRLNIPYLIPATDEDLGRIEITRGPSAVVYGADADRGVVNFVTRSPFDSPGTSLSLTGGGRSTHRFAIRHAAVPHPRFAFKLSGEYFEGSDWPASDPRESVPRDNHIERAGGEARLDWQAGDQTLLVFSAGLAEAINNVDLTEVGSIQVKNWRYTFGQVRMIRNRWFANLFLNQNNAGETFQLFTGNPITDNSRTISGQLQHGVRRGGLDLQYGLDLQHVLSRTEGTIHGRNEDRDDVSLAGLFVSSSIDPSPGLSLLGSLRADHHSVLDDLVLSPRIGVVYKPAPSHALRLTWNRATSTPVASDLFVDIRVLDQVGQLPYSLQARGTAEPFTFRRNCGGGLCMRSAFKGDPRQYLPMDATLLWPWVVGYIQANTGYDLSGIPAPTAGDVSTRLGLLNRSTLAFDPVRPEDVRDIPAARRSFNSTIEAGYRGYLGRRFAVSLDVYHSRMTNVLTASTIQTPSAFLDRATLEAYLAGFIPSQDAATIAAAVQGIPLGTISPNEADSTELIALGRQSARVTFWGADLNLSLGIGRGFSFLGGYSWTSKDRVPASGMAAEVVFNAPSSRLNLGLGYRNAPAGVSVEARGRTVSSFPVASGEFHGEVSAYAVVDFSASYRLPWAPPLTLTLSVENLLDERHREFAGAPVLGRLILARIRANL